MEDGKKEVTAITLGCRVALSQYDLIAIPFEDLKKIVNAEITHGLAAELVKSDVVKLMEEPDFSNMAKVIRAEVVVMTREEYARLKKIEQVFLYQ